MTLHYVSVRVKRCAAAPDDTGMFIMCRVHIYLDVPLTLLVVIFVLYMGPQANNDKHLLMTLGPISALAGVTSSNEILPLTSGRLPATMRVQAPNLFQNSMCTSTAAEVQQLVCSVLFQSCFFLSSSKYVVCLFCGVLALSRPTVPKWMNYNRRMET